MAFQSGDLFVVNRAGVDYKALITELLAQADSSVGKGDIVLTAGAGLESVGTATHNANQDVSTSQTFSVKTGDGLEINANGEIVIRPGAGIDIDLDGNIIIDPTFDLSNQVELALNDLTDVDDTGASEGEVLAKLPDGTYGFQAFAELPAALHPRGFIQVKNPAPADPAAGDFYIQHDETGTDVDGQIADASFTGFAGELVTEGEFVFYGTDDQWHHGGHVGGTGEIQSDWAEEDTASLSYIKNKPCVYECHDYIQHLEPLPN